MSTSSHKRHDLDLVPFAEHAAGVQGARDQLEVALDGHVPRLHVQGFEEPLDGGPRVDLARLVRLGEPRTSVEAGGPVSAPVRGADGTVWVHRPDTGEVCALRGGAGALDCPAARI